MKTYVLIENYIPHNNHPIPSLAKIGPSFYMKPDSALLMNHKPFFLPAFAEDFCATVQLVVKVGRLGKCISEKFAMRYYTEVTAGVSIVANDLLKELQHSGLPWDVAVGFDGSAVIGEFKQLVGEGLPKNGLKFRLDLNGETLQQGDTSMMKQSVEATIAQLSNTSMLKMGDLIYMGAPCEGIKLAIDNHIEAYLGQEKVLDFYVR